MILAGVPRRAALIPWALVGLALAYAALLHHGLGPRWADGAGGWYVPRGFLLALLADSALAPWLARPAARALLLAAPALALGAAIFATTRSPLARTLAVAAWISAALFAFYGFGRARLVWRFFEWRGSAAMVGVAAVLAVALTAPFWIREWLRLGRAWQALTFAAAAFAVVALERNVTGTDPTLPLAVSPWPVIPVFGLEVGAALCALVFGAMAPMLAGLAMLQQGGARRRAGGLALLLAGLVLPAAALLLGSSAAVLPFRIGLPGAAGLSAAAAAGAAAAAWLRVRGRPDALRRRAWIFLASALAIGVPLAAGAVLARTDYAVTRNVIAPRVIEALERYRAAHGVYPDTLEELVDDGLLDALPEPRIGFGLLRRHGFVYQSFGTSFLLEFSAPRWVQCAYNPPYDEADEDGEETLAFAAPRESLPGAWSCPSQPPELW